MRVIAHEPSGEDALDSTFYAFMGDLVGTVENVYNEKEIAVKVDPESLPKVATDVHDEAANRMRAKFFDSVGEEQKKMLTKEEIRFPVNYMILVRSDALEKL